MFSIGNCIGFLLLLCVMLLLFIAHLLDEILNECKSINSTGDYNNRVLNDSYGVLRDIKENTKKG